MKQGMTLKERLEVASKVADEALEAILSESLGLEEFTSAVRTFTLAKFFLTEDEARVGGGDDILELANTSVEKMLRNADKSVTLAEGSSTCTNQSSTDIKKILLSMTLQRALEVRFTPEESADLETIPQLAAALYEARKDSNRAR